MNIVLAQIKKDFYCQRTLVYLWGVCLGLGLLLWIIFAALPHLQRTHVELSDTQQIAGVVSIVAVVFGGITVIGFGMFLLLPILVILIVHEDVLVSSTSFWRTRPVPREKLLLAKALFIAALVIPLLVGAHGAQAGQDQFWPAEAAWIVALAALASITPRMQTLFGYGLALFFGKQIFSGIINRVWIHYTGGDSIFPAAVSRTFSSFREMLHINTGDFFHLCYLAGFSAVFIHQYLTLRTKKSLWIYIATLLIVAIFQMLASQPPDPSAAPQIQIQTWHSTP